MKESKKKGSRDRGSEGSRVKKNRGQGVEGVGASLAPAQKNIESFKSIGNSTRYSREISNTSRVPGFNGTLSRVPGFNGALSRVPGF